jgi:hypothetical protein
LVLATIALPPLTALLLVSKVFSLSEIVADAELDPLPDADAELVLS